MRLSRTRLHRVSWCCAAIVVGTGFATGDAAAVPPSETVFVAISPCRIIDTRCPAPSTCSAARLSHTAINPSVFAVHGPTTDYRGQGGNQAGCGIPAALGNQNVVSAIAVNLIAVAPTGSGDLLAWPADQAMPRASVLNYTTSVNLANGVILPICHDLTNVNCTNGDVAVKAQAADAYLVADVFGYFVAETTDITAVNAGTGLTGGGTSGNLTLSIEPAYQLPQGCGPGAVPTWSAGSWACGSPGGGGGVTSITAGTGLTGGTITTSGTIAASFGGNGSAATLAHSDHNHLGQAWTGSGAAIGLQVATTDSGSVGLQGQSSSATGAGVVALNTGGGIGFELAGGGLQIKGAGLDTSTAVFTHQATASTILIDGGTTLNFGDSTLLLMISPVADITPPTASTACAEDTAPSGVRFVPGSGGIPAFWEIYHFNGSSVTTNACWNVLVVHP